MSKKTCIILVGPPCSGKSATGKLTASKMNIEYISSGDIAREMAKYNAQIGIDLSVGMMAPEVEMRKRIDNKLWYNFIKNDRDIVILDGFPRFGDQAKWLRTILPATINILYVMFDTSSQVIAKRSIDRNREDDKSIEKRLEYYLAVTFPELCKHINHYINTDNNTIEECSELLIEYIKEVTDIVKDC